MNIALPSEAGRFNQFLYDLVIKILPHFQRLLNRWGGEKREKPSVDALNRDLPAIKISSIPQSQKYLLSGTIFIGRKSAAPYPINVVFNTL